MGNNGERVKLICNRAKAGFEGFALSVKLLAVFAAAAGVTAALADLLMPEKCSLHNISSRAELWIVIVMLIAMKCKKPSEAAMYSAGVVFASHFLCALIKTPFDMSAMTDFITWVPIIALAVPFAYYLRVFFDKGGTGKMLMLLGTAAVFVLYALSSLKTFIHGFPYQFIAMLFCFGAAAWLIYPYLKEHDNRPIAAAVCGVALLIGGIYMFAHTYRYSCVVLVKYPINSSWSVSSEDEDISKAEIEGGDEGSLVVTFYESDANTYTLKDPDGNEYSVVLSYDEEKGVNIQYK